jgi:DNA repair exonuclease SbcCD ATPase subunit
MANEDLFEFSAKMDVEVEKGSLDKAKGILDAFYAKYHDRKMKVDTSDMVKAFRGGITEIRKLYDQGMNQMAKDGFAWWDTEDGLENSFSIARSKMNDFFDDLKVSFSDGSVVSGLGNILEKSLENVSIVAVDLGDRINYLQSEIIGTMNALKSLGAVKYNQFGTYSFDGDNMTSDQLQNRIELLREIFEYQQELESFNGFKFSSADAPSGMQTSGLKNHIRQLKFDLQALEEYNLRTTDQLKKRNELIAAAKNEYEWDTYDHDNAKENIHDDDIYEYSLERLNGFIDARKAAIADLKQYEDELFSVDGISQYVYNAEAEIARFEKAKLELQNLKSGKPIDAESGLTGNLTEVVEALGKIETAVKSVVDAFKPLTDALANEDSAIGAMVRANIEDLQKLQAKVRETFDNIETLSSKQFNVTNVISNGNNANNDIEQFRQFRKEARDIFKEVEELYTESITTSQKIKSTPGGLSAFLDFNASMSDFDLSDLAKRIKSKSATSLAAVIDELNEWKNVLLQFNNLRNDVEAGSFNASKYNRTSYKVNDGSQASDNDATTIAETTNVDDNNILQHVKDLSAQAEEELSNVRSKIEETFNLSTLDPKLFDITPVTQSIYQQFEELQKNVSNLKFTIEATPTVVSDNVGASATADAIDDEVNAVKNAEGAFEDAAKAKGKFTESNKKAADAAAKTTPKIESEVNAAESAYQTFAKFTFNEKRGVSEAEFNTFAANIAKNKNLKVKSASLTRGESGKAIGGNITFVDPETLQEIRERYSVRPKEGSDDEVELYRASYTLVENTAKAEQKAANEATRRSKAIADSNKWLIEQEDLLTKQENKYQASSGAAKPLEGTSGLIRTSVLSGVDATLDGLVSNIRSRINDAKGGIITQDFKNEIIKDLNALSNEIQVQQARKYPGTSLRATSIETSRDVYRNEIEGLVADAKKAGVYDQMSATLTELTSGVETFTEDTFNAFRESVKKANSQFQAEKKKLAQRTKEEKSQNDAMWAEHEAEQRAAAEEKEKERQIELGWKQYEAEQEVETKRIKAEEDRASNEFFDTTHTKELNALYQERSDIITRIIQLNKKLSTLKTDKAKDKTKDELKAAKDKLATLDIDISEYGDYVDKSKLNKQNRRLKNNDIDIGIEEYDAKKKIYDDAIKAQDKLYSIKKQLAKVDAGSARGLELSRKAKDYQEQYEEAAKLLDTEEQRTEVANRQRKLDKELAAIKERAQNNYGKTVFNREERYNGNINARMSDFDGKVLGDNFKQKLNEYKAVYAELEQLRNKFIDDPDAENDKGLQEQFNKAAINCEKLRKEILGTFKEYDKFADISQASILGEDTFDPAKMADVKTAMMQLAVAATDGQFQFKGFNDAGTEMYGVIEKGAGVLEKVTVRFNGATNEMKAFTTGTQQVTTSWSRLGAQLKNGINQIVGRYIGFHELWQAVKQGVNYVKEIDLAMTELKKVTDETDEAYRNFLTTASKTAATIGSTVSDFTDATAAFARLGYSLNESAKMAETAIIYKNVADGLDSVEESTDSIISTMMAYGIAADDTMSIIDRFNAVGNNFAITSAGIGDAMQRSASALKEGGNTIDESIALITAAM